MLFDQQEGGPLRWTEWASTASAVFSAIAAGGAWRVAIRGWRTAEKVASIEQNRWHKEATPKFQISIQRTSPSRATLRLTFEGPSTLGTMHSVEVAIRNHTSRRVRRIRDSDDATTPVVQGPYRFSRYSDDASANGRYTRGEPMSVGSETMRFLERTTAPAWAEEAEWGQVYDDAPVHLWVHARREGYRSWSIPFEVPVTDA
jgi:hypothetical protein